MKAYELYTVRKLVRGILLVLFVLAGLFSLTELIDQLRDVGRGTYGWLDAFLHVAMTLPARTLEVVPLAALLGSILALGAMATANELVALRSVGVSPGRISVSALKAAMLLAVGALLVAEFVAPELQRSAAKLRSFEVHDPAAIQLKRGFWFREGTSFVEVRKVLPGRRLEDVVIYEFDDAGSLRSRTCAREAQIFDSGRWVLSGVERDVLGEEEIETAPGDTVQWDSTFGASLLDLMILSPATLSISELAAYVRDMRQREQAYARYELHLWRYLGLPLSVSAMVLLAVPFVFALRRSSSGLRTTLGVLVGALTYALDRLGGYAGLLIGLSPIVTALAPSVVTLAVACFFLRRMR